MVSGTDTVLKGAVGSEAKINLRVTLLLSIYNYLFKHAFKNDLINGCALKGLDLNSGWN